MKSLHKIVLGVLLYWLIFVTVAWIAFFTVGSVPDSLIQYGLGGGSVELLATAGIEIAKRIIDRNKRPEDHLLDMIDLDEGDEIHG